jgi:hypothetical protein
MKKLFIAGALAIASASSVALSSPAKAACTLDNSPTNNCTTFNPNSASNVVYGNYIDGGWVANDRLTNISFYSTNITAGLPITLTNIAYSLDGTNFITTNLSSTSYTITANGAPGSGTNLLTAYNLGGAIGNTFKLRYDIPAIPGLMPTNGMATIAAYAGNEQSSGPPLPQNQTRDSAAYITSTPTSAVPGPLPLIGAAAAFSFSRKARQRIKQAG